MADGSIRVAQPDDAKRIAAIFNQAIVNLRSAVIDVVTEEDRGMWLRSHQEPYHVFVYETEVQVVGWSSISAYRPGRRALAGAVEVSYYIDYDYHRRGIGSELLAHAIEYCKTAGFDIVFAVLLENNEPSIGLLKKFGFEQWAHLPGIANFDGPRVGQVYYGRRL